MRATFELTDVRCKLDFHVLFIRNMEDGRNGMFKSIHPPQIKTLLRSAYPLPVPNFAFWHMEKHYIWNRVGGKEPYHVVKNPKNWGTETIKWSNYYMFRFFRPTDIFHIFHISWLNYHIPQLSIGFYYLCSVLPINVNFLQSSIGKPQKKVLFLVARPLGGWGGYGPGH